MNNLLLISPSFFGYQLEIQKAFEKKGFIVHLVDDRPSNSVLSKALLRLNKRLISSQIDRYFLNQFEQVKNIPFSNVVILNPEAINEYWIQTLQIQHPKAKFNLYLWDSFINKPNFRNLTYLFETVYTFDLIDAKTYSLSYLPLFFTDDFEYEPGGAKSIYDLCFIGTGHGDRPRIAKALLRKYCTYFVSNFIFLFLQTKLLFFYFKLKDAQFKGSLLSDFNFQSLSLKYTALRVKESRFILDINHKNQRGLTMRTMEVHGARRKLITTNPNIKNEDFYHPNNIYVMDRQSLEIADSFLQSEYHELDNSLYQKYSIHAWIENLIR
jgi:hypothetical protein